MLVLKVFFSFTSVFILLFDSYAVSFQECSLKAPQSSVGGLRVCQKLLLTCNSGGLAAAFATTGAINPKFKDGTTKRVRNCGIYLRSPLQKDICFVKS